VAGEAVFCTGMVGYPESLTDPSYRGQILTMTQPLMGNYGVPGDEIDEWGVRKFFESDRIQASALIVQDYSTEPSHWNCKRTLSSWLQEYEIPALYGIDTRELTKRIRERGVMLGKIVFDNDIPFEDINQRNLVAEVSLKQPRVFNPKGELKILAYDCGVKYHLIRSLCERGAQVKLVPWDYDLTNESFDGLFISNGPGDPSLCDKTVTAIQAAMAMNKPIFGVCMGNQVCLFVCLFHVGVRETVSDIAGTAAGAVGGRADLQAQVRQPRPQPAGHRHVQQPLLHHVAEPRLCGRPHQAAA
jgi:carbamoyl-phosphate synthase small subunit